MFRRDDEAQRFSVAGLWGSGNTVSPRAALLAGDPTVYSMWDGHALWGPDRPDAIERFPILVAVLDISTFLERYRGLGPAQCTVWDGEEILGIGCEDACVQLGTVCNEADLDACMAECAELPRAVIECLAFADTCGVCGRERWAFLNR